MAVGKLNMREFRVKKVVRYIVTDWADYRDGGAGVREIAEAPNVKLANEVAETFGRAFPDAMVNLMTPESESYGLPLPAAGSCAPSSLEFTPDEQALRALPYNIAAGRRRLARYANDEATLQAMDRAGVAVDA